MRGLIRLGSLLVVVFMLVTALTIPAGAKDVKCPHLWDKIVIENIQGVEPVKVWDAGDLLSYGDGKDSTKTPVGELDVKFRPLARMDFDGYRITATPSEDDPGTSKELGVKAMTHYVSHAAAQDTVRLNLEPGTKYYLEVVAVNDGLGDTEYVLSKAQGTQDNNAGVTWLSPPFLGRYTNQRDTSLAATGDSKLYLPDTADRDGVKTHRGTHFLVYLQDQDLHLFNWLNPSWFGPFDHEWKRSKEGKEGADILCMEDDGSVGRCPKDAKDRGITHYRVQISDIETGMVEYQQNVELAHVNSYNYGAYFNLADGTYDFSVHAGRLDGTTWRPMSGKAVVRFDVTDDYLKYNQSFGEWVEIMGEIQDGLTNEDDYEAWFDDSPWRYYQDRIGGRDDATDVRPKPDGTAYTNKYEPWPTEEFQRNGVKLIAYLNIQYD